MGEIKGLLKYKRKDVSHRPVEERIKDFKETDIPLGQDELIQQAARCMDCGIPFCHGFGCPLHNQIPEFNDLVYKGKWRQACENLHLTNNFPEFTSRLCPAPCETACTLQINDKPVLIKHIEYNIVEMGFKEGWIKPQIAEKKTGKKVAVIGSGPAGLTVAQQLARAGHSVVIFEKDEKIGGMLRYGIPDFKLDKSVIDRRLKQLSQEGVEFQTGVMVGEDISAHYLKKMYDCICLNMGAGQPRDLNIPGRGYENILFAWDYLKAQNQRCSGEPVDFDRSITAFDRTVVVIGGGDTGSDCVGTAQRQGAQKIYQLEILPKPPDTRPMDTPWPTWPRIMRTSSSHEEGCERMWSIMTKKFRGDETRVRELLCCRVEWVKNSKGYRPVEIPDSEFTIKADLVLLALGFVHVVHEGLVNSLGLKTDERGNLVVDNYQTSEYGIFAAGDSVSGASLIVNAINDGRGAASAIDKWLRNES